MSRKQSPFRGWLSDGPVSLRPLLWAVAVFLIAWGLLIWWTL
jgi:hypothetical protein